MIRSRLTAAAAAVAALALTACGGSSGTTTSSSGSSCTNVATSQGVEKDKVTVAVVGDYTGPTQATQEPWLRGVQTYLKFANDHGGICGKQIAWQEADDKYTVPGGQAAWKQFTEQTPVLFYFGNNNSSVQNALNDQVKNGDLPIMALSSEHTSLYPVNRNFYQNIETYQTQADVQLAYYNQKLANGQKPKAVCFSLTVSSGTEYCNAVQERVTGAGGTFIKHYAIPSTSVDATPEVQQIQASAPNVIFVHGSPNTAITLFKAMDKLGMTSTPVLGIFATMAENVFLTAPQSVTKNFVGIHSYTPAYISTPGNDEMNAASKKYGVDQTLAQNINFVSGWVAGKVFVAGARAGSKATGKVDHNAVRQGMDSLKNFDTGGQSPNYQYSATDHQGVRDARPYSFDFTKKQLQPVGQYADWAQYVKIPTS